MIGNKNIAILNHIKMKFGRLNETTENLFFSYKILANDHLQTATTSIYGIYKF